MHACETVFATLNASLINIYTHVHWQSKKITSFSGIFIIRTSFQECPQSFSMASNFPGKLRDHFASLFQDLFQFLDIVFISIQQLQCLQQSFLFLDLRLVQALLFYQPLKRSTLDLQWRWWHVVVNPPGWIWRFPILIWISRMIYRTITCTIHFTKERGQISVILKRQIGGFTATATTQFFLF